MVNKKTFFVFALLAVVLMATISLTGCGTTSPAGAPAGPNYAVTFSEVYVVNRTTGVIKVFDRLATGAATPLRTITYGQPGAAYDGIVVDKVNNEVYTMNEQGTIYVLSRTASGTVTPLRTISGPATTLSTPVLLTVDTTNNEIVVANFLANSIITFTRTASGAVAPIRTLAGAATLLNRPEGVTINPVTNELIVANNSAVVGITIYPRTATGNVAPTRQITTATNACSIVVDYINNEIIVGSQAGAVTPIKVFAADASGAAVPLRSVATGGFAVALDNTNNEIWGTNLFVGTVDVYSRTASGAAPLRTLTTGPLWGIATY